MGLTVQTNIASLIAQNNLNVNDNFMQQTIERLSSGYRINSSADDAAGLVIANQYRSSVTELTQGVANANDGISTLQIVDGGLSNISTMLDRMKTLATQSASGTFSGNRGTLDQEYQQLVTEINRQAANIGLNAGGTNNVDINVYIGGGGASQTNSQVSVDLSGTGNTVDATGLGLAGTSLLAAGSALTGNTVDLNSFTNILSGAGANASQTLTFNLAGGTSFQAQITSPTNAGITVADAVQQLNTALSAHGLSASVDSSTGGLLISGDTAFTVTGGTPTVGVNTGLVTAASTGENTSMYTVDAASTNAPEATFTGIGAGADEKLQFSSNGNSVTLDLTQTNAGTATTALQTLNNQLAALGISAVLGTDGSIQFQSDNAFSITKAVNPDGSGGDQGVFADSSVAAKNNTATAPTVTGGATGNALNSITAIDNAISVLGNVQGTVGAGENKLNYAIGLATSQITSFSAAESSIRDANMAQEAANLTKAQILQQSTIAAMAQANAMPQAVLALLK